MSNTDKEPDQEKGDEILRRMLNTPPDPKSGKSQKKDKPNEDDSEGR